MDTWSALNVCTLSSRRSLEVNRAFLAKLIAGPSRERQFEKWCRVYKDFAGIPINTVTTPDQVGVFLMFWVLKLKKFKALFILHKPGVQSSCPPKKKHVSPFTSLVNAQKNNELMSDYQTLLFLFEGRLLIFGNNGI